MSQARTRLSKLVLPKFKGDVTTWTAFLDSYKSAVHDNREISAVDKFNYLKSLLEGPAVRCIEGLPITEHDYRSAVDLLQHRFGRTQQVITAHMDELLKIAGCNNDRSSSLRFVFDKINVHVRGLASLRVVSKQYGSLLIPIIMSKLPNEVRLRIARETKEEVWKIGDLLQVIQAEVEAREASENIKVNPARQAVPGQRFSNNPGATASSLFSGSGKIQCVYCGKDHFSASCSKISNISDRKDILLKAGRCFNCLRTNHKSRDCSNPKNCRFCHRRHHQSICEVHAEKPAHNPEPNPESNSVTNTTNSLKGKCTILLQTAQAIATNQSEGVSRQVRVLFDGGSQRSYITKRLQSKLHLKPIRCEKLYLNTFGDNKFKSQNRDILKLFLHRPGSQDKIVVISFPIICSSLPSPVNIQQFPHLKDLKLADSSDGVRGEIDVLIGSDFYWNFMIEGVAQGERGPTTINSKLGWLLSGPTHVSTCNCKTVSNVIVTGGIIDASSSSDHEELTTVLRKFWDTEALGIQETSNETTENDQAFLKDVKYKEGHYEVSLPWIRDYSELPCHYNLSFNRLKYLQFRLLRRPELLTEYNNIFREQLQKGIIERVETDSIAVNVTHYMPHHAVIREDKKTTKLRIVYDGSARGDGDELSLNDCLQTGPNMIPKLFDILVKFRLHPIALVADIEKAFLMIGITEEDRDKLRFLWFENPNDIHSPIIQFRFKKVVYGLRPSPAILGAVISHHLSSYISKNAGVVQIIRDSLYVDDLVCGESSVEKAFKIYRSAKRMMLEGGFNLRKCNSNSNELLRRVQIAESMLDDSPSHKPTSTGVITEEEESYAKFITSNCMTTDFSKVLGVIWDSNSDDFMFDFFELVKYARSLPPSKRSLLRVTAKIFDPLGLWLPL